MNVQHFSSCRLASAHLYACRQLGSDNISGAQGAFTSAEELTVMERKGLQHVPAQWRNNYLRLLLFPDVKNVNS